MVHGKTKPTAVISQLRGVSLWEAVVFVFGLVIVVPAMVVLCLARRLWTPSDYSLKIDVFLTCVRCLGWLPLSIRRRSANPDYITVIQNSSRFSNTAELCSKVSKDSFEGYWVCKGPVAGAQKPPYKSTITLLWIHGGAYITGAALAAVASLLRVAELASEEDISISIFALEYSLAPEAMFPTQINEATAAYQYLIEELGIDPSTILVMGESAGGHLALSLAYTLQQQGLPRPGKLGLIYPWANLENSGATFKLNKNKDCLNKADMNHCTDLLLGHDGRLEFADVLNFSLPLRNNMAWSRILPSTWVVIGGNDVLLSDVCSFVDEARKDGVILDFHIEPGMPHGWLGYFDAVATKKYLQLNPTDGMTSAMIGSEMIAKVVLAHAHDLHASAFVNKP